MQESVLLRPFGAANGRPPRRYAVAPNDLVNRHCESGGVSGALGWGADRGHGERIGASRGAGVGGAATATTPATTASSQPTEHSQKSEHSEHGPPGAMPCRDSREDQQG